jgi:hypothetical protein
VTAVEKGPTIDVVAVGSGVKMTATFATGSPSSVTTPETGASGNESPELHPTQAMAINPIAAMASLVFVLFI